LISGNVITTQQVIFNGQNYFIRCGLASEANIQIANATVGTSNISQYKIHWGDTSSDTTFTVFPATLVHKYLNGFYTLTLTTTSVDNCSSGVSYGVFVGNSPQGALGNPGNLSGCSPVSITFPITNTNVNVPGTTYKIDFGDGTVENYTHPNIPATVTHIYTESSCGKTASTGQVNSYAASMKIVNPCNEALSTISPIQISTSGTPKISISKNVFCVNDNVTIIDSSLKGGFISGANCLSGNSIYWTIIPSTGWTTSNNLGINGGTPNDADNWVSGDNLLNVVFNSPGTYTVSLHSANGCNSTNPKIKDTIICITPIPTASFTTPKDTLCGGDNLNFTSTSNIPLCGSNQYKWTITKTDANGCSVSVTPTFISGTSDTSANPILNFSAAGSYVISLKITIKGTTCTSTTFSKPITVKDKPIVTLSLSPTTICQGATLSPTVTADCFTANATTYNWTFSNSASPSSSSNKIPGIITFNNTGTSLIKVGVTNVCGTTNQQTNITINETPNVDSIPNFILCAGQTFAQLNFTGTVSGATYTWAASAGAIGLPTITTNKINSFTTINSTTNPITVTITVTPTKGVCTG
ncbi:MAG: hypothetical protein ACOVOV_01770, partial [Dolichospermum sp.]